MSLAELPELVGLFSYSREDDEGSKGLSRLRDFIQRELGSQLGRSRRDFRLWQDKESIAHGMVAAVGERSARSLSLALACLAAPPGWWLQPNRKPRHSRRKEAGD